MNRPDVDYMVSGLIAFAMGVCKGIVAPEDRSLVGFVSAIVVGVCCGLVAATIAAEFGSPSRWQNFLSALFGIIGHQFVQWIVHVITRSAARNQTIHINDQGIANVGDNQLNGDQTDERR